MCEAFFRRDAVRAMVRRCGWGAPARWCYGVVWYGVAVVRGVGSARHAVLLGTSSMPLSSAVSVDLQHPLLPPMAGLVGKKHARARRTNARLPPRCPRACACVGSWARECARESALPALTLRASCVHFCIAALPLPVCLFVCLFVCLSLLSLSSFFLSLLSLSLSFWIHPTNTHTHTHTHTGRRGFNHGAPTSTLRSRPCATQRSYRQRERQALPASA